MCGIVGEASFGQINVLPENVKKMCKLLVHRGPDEEGYHVSSHAVLGIRRLKIIGLINGSQPVYNFSSSAICVFNGEIYNYRELKSSLEKDGYIFKTNTDAEVIIHLYDKVGTKFVEHLRGMFAIAIYDQQKNRLILTRDRTGQKPLNYFVSSKGNIIFSSELNSLTSHPSIKKNINLEAIDQFLSFRIISTPSTIYRDIFKVEPGTVVTFDGKRIETEKYWTFDFSESFSDIPQKNLVKEIENLLFEAIEIRLNSEVPLGAFLSGGLDSSLIVSMTSKLIGKPIHTFSIGFENQKFNELNYAKIVSNYCKTIHHEYLICPQLALSVIDKLLVHFGEPFAFPSAIACYFMNKLAKEFVTVVLSGDGSDEIFCGYDRYKFFDNLPKLPTQSNLLTKIDQELFDSALGDISVEYQSILTDGLRNSLKFQLYSKNFISHLLEFPVNYLKDRFVHTPLNNHRLTRVMEVDCNFWLRDAQLVKIDITSMANSVEVRCPMLDHKLIEFVSKVDVKHKLVNGQEKHILKIIAEKFLPREIVNRPKQELAIPLENWLTTYLRQEISNTLLSEEALSRGYFNPDTMIEFVNNYSEVDSYAIWTLYVLEKWHNLNGF